MNSSFLLSKTWNLLKGRIFVLISVNEELLHITKQNVYILNYHQY